MVKSELKSRCTDKVGLREGCKDSVLRDGGPRIGIDLRDIMFYLCNNIYMFQSEAMKLVAEGLFELRLARLQLSGVNIAASLPQG